MSEGTTQQVGVDTRGRAFAQASSVYLSARQRLKSVEATAKDG